MTEIEDKAQHELNGLIATRSALRALRGNKARGMFLLEELKARPYLARWLRLSHDPRLLVAAELRVLISRELLDRVFDRGGFTEHTPPVPVTKDMGPDCTQVTFEISSAGPGPGGDTIVTADITYGGKKAATVCAAAGPPLQATLAALRAIGVNVVIPPYLEA